MRTVVFGVDGLTFRVLHPMMDRGELPNFGRLRREGCEAILESKYPPLTPPAWTSLSTGLKPARHGVYDFWSYDERSRGAARTARVQTRRKGGKAIWNILSEYGKQVLVINVPMTYPPEPVNGIMVSGYMTPSNDANFVYPGSFKEELFRAVPGYTIDLDYSDIWNHPRPRALERLIDATLTMTERRIELTMHLMQEQPWDFCYVVFVGPDRLQHPLWQQISALEKRATDYFRLLDHALGLILEQLGPDDTLFVVSDHGFQGAPRLFDINEYLFDKGLLVPNSTYRRTGSRRSATLKRALERARLLQPARRVKRRMRSAGIGQPAGQEMMEHYSALSVIDWERTLACVPSHSGFGGGYADIFLSERLGEDLLSELREDLMRLRDPRDGGPLVEALYTTEVFGTGPFAPSEPHLLVLPAEGITFRVTLGNERWWDEPNVVRGTHQKDGVLYAYGGGIKRGGSAEGAEIYDLVPTVLYSMELPFPTTFDGRVLDELFAARSAESATHTPQAAQIAAGTGVARRKLHRLLEE